jgi:hypothetical protein
MYKIPPRTSSAPRPIRNILASPFIAGAHNRTGIQAGGGRIVPAAGTIVAVRFLDRPARINLRAFPAKRIVSGSSPGPSAFIGD